jgi:3-oxoacyl-[acyl-carrier protein] reductase
VKRLGLPNPPKLRRHQPGDPLVPGPVLYGAAAGGRLGESVAKAMSAAAVELREPDAAHRGDRPPLNAALVFDATGISGPGRLRALYDFFHRYLRSLYPNGRVIVFGTPPAECGTAAEAAAQQALEGFTRSLARELVRGGTAQLVRVGNGAERNIESTLRFLVSARSAYVSGQVIHVTPGPVTAPADWDQPLAGKVAAVTGAARGIGEAVAATLARDGAHVICLDLPSAGDELAAVANGVGGSAIQLDLTAADTPERLVSYLEGRHGRIDVMVHNAGITRDRTLANMGAALWDEVIDVNLSSVDRIIVALLAADLIPQGGRLVGIGSLTGIAGNRGQTNYATSKAGLVGLMRALAGDLAGREVTANAVAPGFIESRLTARMPLVVREAGRRMNSLAQAGLPVDVAETVAWLASPASGGVTANVVRVCGQSVLGA